MLRRVPSTMWILAILGALTCVRLTSGHVCSPCECSSRQKQAVGSTAALCAVEYGSSVAVRERTTQLVSALAADTRCSGVNASAVMAAADAAHAAHLSSVAAAGALRADVAEFVSYKRLADANAFTAALQGMVREMGASGTDASDELAAGLGLLLKGCFNLTPVNPTPPDEQRVSAYEFSPPAPQGGASGGDAGDVLFTEAVLVQDDGPGNVALAWGLTAMAGASTVLGAALVGVISDTNYSLIAFLNALTAGVMLQGSLSGLAAEAAVLAAESANPTIGFWAITVAFFGGAGVCVALEFATHYIMSTHGTEGSGMNDAVGKGVTEGETEGAAAAGVAPARKGGESSSVEEGSASVESISTAKFCCHDHAGGVEIRQRMSKRSVVVLVAGVTLHNVAEGMATFIAALANKRLGIALALAMVLHNIPEGFAISLPWYSATGQRWQGFLWAAAAGAAEVLAAAVIYVVVISVGSVPIKQTLFACLFAVAGGMMTYIALHELYPHAVRMSPSPTYPTAGVFVGLAIMQLALGQLGIPAPDS